MSIFMLLLFKSLFNSSIENSTHRNNLLDLSKNSWKQSLTFRKRVSEGHVSTHDSHVSRHNSLVELFKCKHKTAFAGGYRSLFFAETLQQCSLIYREPVTPPQKKSVIFKQPLLDTDLQP